MKKVRTDLIEAVIGDLVSNLFFYDRKDSTHDKSLLQMGELEEAFKSGQLSAADVAEMFKAKMYEALGDDGPMMDWRRPCRNWNTANGRAVRSYQTPACIDCEHIRVRAVDFGRKCLEFPDRHIWGPAGSPEDERRESGSVLAETCGKFELASEIGDTQ